RMPRTPRMTKERNHSSEGKQQSKRIEGVNARDIPPPDKHNQRQHHSYFQNGNEPTAEGRFIQPEHPPDVEKRQQYRDGENEKKQQIHGQGSVYAPLHRDGLGPWMKGGTHRKPSPWQQRAPPCRLVHIIRP